MYYNECLNSRSGVFYAKKILIHLYVVDIVEKIIAVPLTEFCRFFLQLSLSERVTESVTLDPRGVL